MPKYVWQIKGVEFDRDTLKNYDVELILQHFWANYGPWLRKQLTQWQLEILAEETAARNEG